MEALVHEWNYYLGTTCGLAQVSASGKALNIELFEAGNFTVSLLALESVVYGRERHCQDRKDTQTTASPAWKDRRLPASGELGTGLTSLSFSFSFFLFRRGFSSVSPDGVQH